MMEVVIVDDGNRLTVYELVERVIPCIIAKHYSENYIQGFRSTFRNLLAYCNKNEKKYFTAELAQQFMLDCYGVQPGTVERRFTLCVLPRHGRVAVVQLHAARRRGQSQHYFGNGNLRTGNQPEVHAV